MRSSTPPRRPSAGSTAPAVPGGTTSGSSWRTSQPFVLALVVPGFGWTAAVVVYGLVVVGAVVVLAAPEELRQPVDFAATVLALAAVLITVAVPAALAWVAPVLFVKLLLGHLLPGEAA